MTHSPLTSLFSKRQFWAFAVLLFGFSALIVTTKIEVFQTNSSILSKAITVDLLCTLPLLYLALIWKTKIKKVTIIPVTIVGMLIGYNILPADQHQFLDFFKIYLLPFVEITVLIIVVVTIKKWVKIANNTTTSAADFPTILKMKCKEIFPSFAVPIVITEVGVFYYGFYYWKPKKLKENEFSYHKNSGTVALLCALILVVCIETVAFHALLSKWSTIAAWILTGLSIYSGLQIFGFVKSMFKRPYAIINNTLYLRYGIMSEAIISLDNIDTIDITSSDFEDDDGIVTLCPFGKLEAHNCIITVKNESVLHSLYGSKKSFYKLALHIDKPAELKAVVSRKNNVAL